MRKVREDSGKSMGALARHLEIAIPYLSDVERGIRGPLSTERIIQAADFLEIDPEDLLIAAAEEKGVYQLEEVGASANENTVMRRETAAALMRRWHQLSNDELARIRRIVNHRKAK